PAPRGRRRAGPGRGWSPHARPRRSPRSPWEVSLPASRDSKDGPDPLASPRMGEVGADPAELARLARTFLLASQRLGDALSIARAQGTLPPAVYGDTTGARRLPTAGDLVVEQAGLAVGRL